MLHRVLILIISVIIFCQVSRSRRLIISPNSKQIVINEGETLNIACVSKLIQFISPNEELTRNISNEDQFKFEEEYLSFDENPPDILRMSDTDNSKAVYQYNISKENATMSDTGWYCCADYKALYMNYSYSYNTEVNWFFVYVKPNKKFVVNENITIHLDASDYTTTILCRQSTDVQPLLIKGNKFKTQKGIFSGLYVTFIPKYQHLRDNYNCSIKADSKTQLRAYNTILFQRHKPIIEIFVEENVSLYVQKRSGDNVELGATVYEDGGKSFLQWINPNGEKIINSPKYYVRFVRYGNSMVMFALLQIIDANIMDSGNYTLQAQNVYLTAKNNFSLDVTDKPISLLTLIVSESHYSLKQSVEFYCDVISNPPSNVTWSFLRYPNYPLFTEKKTVYLTNVTQRIAHYPFYKIKTMVKMLIEVSGQIKCEACNALGCDSKNETILVSDGLGALGIIGPKESVIQGDNIELICAASVYNYTNNFTWTVRVNQTEKLVTQTDRLKLVQHRTPFTYRSTLKLNNVQRSDAQDYFCTVKFITPHQIIDSLPERATYTLIIYDMILPFFINTNMNRTEIRNIYMMTEDLDTVILQCFADGKPKPKVTWYKDNVPLKENDQYLFKYNYQELHIKYFMQHDSGTYSCRAINRAGTNETYQQITVKYTKYDTLELIFVTSTPILSFIIVILTIFITIKICREKKRRRKPDLMHFDGVTSEYINPNLTVKHLAKFLPYDEKWEFPIERLNLKEKLDNGYFGVVMKAEALGICENESVTTVAVKMIRQSDKQIYIHALLSELKIMLHLGKHLNIVNLLGACTKNVSKGELLIIIEYCHFGNLHKYLLSHRYNFINQIDSNTRELDPTIGADILKTTVNVGNDNSNYEDQNFKPICTQDLLSWSFQVARGMEYLSQKKVLHGDLAARNILLAENNVVKICDFGLAKNMDKDYYKKKDSAPMPIKWMAIESIGHRIFTTQSDVWSFGIMLWEFFTLAEKPYTGIEPEELYQKLIEGHRMEQPNYAICEIYNIMKQCWKTEPTSRPSFTNLVESIGNLLEESVKMYYINLNTQYIDMNEINLNVNPGCSKDESEICNPHPLQDHSHIEFPSPESNCEDTIELSPMLKHEEDAHLKPIKNTSKEQNLSDKSKQ